MFRFRRCGHEFSVDYLQSNIDALYKEAQT